MSLIYKILTRAEWDAAAARGVFEGSGIDLKDRYIHFSTAETVKETAALHFAGEADLVLAAIDGDALGEALRYEASRGGMLFPHLYGWLSMDTVRWVRPLPLGPDGRHVFPPLEP